MDSEDEYLDEYAYYNGEEDEDDDNVIAWNSDPYRANYCGFRPSFLFQDHYQDKPRYISSEEANWNAVKLLEEEQREKEKADRKRLKKKRQKDRKRQQKLQEAQSDQTSSEEKAAGEVTKPEDGHSTAQAAGGGNAEQENSSVSASDDDLDLGSTFVRQAQRKMESKPRPERKERAKEPSRERAAERSKESVLPPTRESVLPPTRESVLPPTRESVLPPTRERVLPGSQETAGAQPPPPTPLPNNMNILDRYKIQESLDLANIGNNMAGKLRFSEALQYYTEAIKLNPSEYRFLGNRSYVYDHLGRYEESLADAENALKLEPHFLKGYFRKGKALRGLMRYPEAISAFQQVLLFDGNHGEAATEILHCQQKMQEAMTSTRVKILSSAPLSPPSTPPTSVPGLNNKVFVPRNIYSTANKLAVESPAGRVQGAVSVAGHSKLYPVWVGNVNDKITENVLRQKFEPFGLIHSVRILHSRTCAFVNFTNKEAAEAAFRSLQGLILEGTTFVLQLRNPEHNVVGAPGSRKIGK